MTAKNRRRHTRVRARNIAAHLRVEEPLGQERASLCQVDDISQGGLFLRTDQRLPVGLAVVIDLARPGLKKPLRVTGVVVQASDDRMGMGIRFDPLDTDASQRLYEILRDLGGYAPGLLVDSKAEGAASKPPAAASSTPRPAQPSTPPAPATGSNPFARAPSTTVRPAAVATPAPVPATAGAPARNPFQHGSTPATGMTASSTTTGSVRAPGAPPQEDGKLLIQIKGLLMELGNREAELQKRDRDLQDARDELEKLRHELRRRDDQLYALEQAKLAAERTAGRLQTEKEALEQALLKERGGPALPVAPHEVEKLRAEAELALEHASRLAEMLRRIR